jgi:hypothetical protein
MISIKYQLFALAAILMALSGCASAQWSPGGSMVYMGDLNLAASSLSSGKEVQVLGGSPAQAAINNSSMSNSSSNNGSINATSTEGLNGTGSNAVLSPAGSKNGLLDPTNPSLASDSTGKEVLDLSGYSRDRVNRNLAGYTNIMYPISGSRGTTTSTSGGGGCGGCGS